MSLYDLALVHREAVENLRNISFVQNYEKWVAAPLNGGGLNVMTPAPLKKNDGWMFLNQVVAGIEQFNLGEELLGFWEYLLPVYPDHTFALNKLRGGYVLDGFSGIRPTRMASIEKALKGIREGQPLVL
ncbi:hypothetical protein BDP27DRAFT_1315370 [Rhodocollybia butyracea]|uniref:Uncharacterized protein n=1 Tax=Rhodocollybia butyracea TaxID=206335 RepID=A0A9P5Q6V9_9AGAR|nr:hypothetical protein BDP27DRAFT_1315370 [Rhodocollybia butyracea]